MTEPSKQNIRAVSRALAVLNSFSQKRSQTLADVTNATGLDKGTTRRLLITLMDNGYVAQDPTTQQYRIGRALRMLAADVPDGFDLRSVANPVLTQLASELPVTAFVSVYDDGDVVCLDRLHDMKGIEVHWWAVGGTLPYNCGGAPKLLLAYQSPEEIERVLTREPTPMTRASIVDRDVLRARLKEIAAQDYEFAIDDVALGLTALAVPVRAPGGGIAGAISIAGLTPQLVTEDGQAPVHLEDLREAARQIERRIQLAGAE
ncbi:IclR family transcriptional regulator [Acuticoccus sp. I52.16.1]|uniref:IclR family transcriptional regulator n=1 Tax=Acuticoccus sp. I52.16.1 TaxID=2928472 RepID=UPI001FCF843B|nr:IclR family transcriptional regulator [Acuticoccus sp. I52.16.1]UOM35388.1 IclR family transcriptional regulator [Acuticoccus sp. I52.16.1]